ncbi:sulfatase-like hydrolase/transferase [candidate division KSB1 bacterium]|nr:sulfatase-like hydrolase/transferase [candidate division KSB1 bacterium]
MGKRMPNVLWICADQQRYDTIHCLNNPHIHTPNLDRLCSEGVAFTHAYCQSSVCSPSRTSFLTGLYPSTVHVNRNGLPAFPSREGINLITKRLADIGYNCGLAGKLHLASAWNGVEKRTDDGYKKFWYCHAPHQGIGRGNQYTDWLISKGIDLDNVFRKNRRGEYGAIKPTLAVENHLTTWCADRAIEFMSETSDGPWLMSVNMFDPHPPFDAPAAYRNRYNPEKLPPPLFSEKDEPTFNQLQSHFFQSKFKMPDEKEQEHKASYYGMIELIDEQVGRMLDFLDETGQRENTLVIFHSDGGETLGDHGLTAKGCRFYEGLVRVPLIISWPGQFEQGLRSDALVGLMDITPTLYDIVGIKPAWTHGKSLLPILKGEASPHVHREDVRCEYYDALNMFAPDEPEKHTSCWATMYRDERYKLNVYHGNDYGELYDLVNDPDEFDNLWNDVNFQTIKSELIKKSFDASIVIADPGPTLIGRY